MALKDLIRKVHGSSKLSAALDVFLLKDETLPNNREEGWHVSSFAGACPRALAIDEILDEMLLFAEDSGISPKVRRIFDYGTALHEWYQNRYLGPMGILWGKWICTRCRTVRWGFMPKNRHSCEPSRNTHACTKLCSLDGLGQYDEKKAALRGGCIHCAIWGRWHFGEVPVRYVSDELKLPIIGHSDGLIYPARKWLSLEMKSRKDPMFQFMSEAAKEHVAQGKVYAHMIRKGHVRGLPKGIECPKPEGVLIVYLGKNVSEEKEFKHEIDDSEGEELFSVPFQAEKARKEKTLPPRWKQCENLLSPIVKKCEFGSFCFTKKPRSEWKKLKRKKRYG